MPKNKHEDKVVYPHTPDSYIGSKNNGSTDDVMFDIQMKKPKDESNMSTIQDAYKPRHKEYR